TEREAAIRRVLQGAAARIELASPDAARRLESARVLGESSDPAVKALLAALLEKTGPGWAQPDAGVRAAAAASIRAIERRVATAEIAGTVFSGLSLGSILLDRKSTRLNSSHVKIS